MNLHNVVVADIKPKTESAPLRDRLLATRALSTELAAPLERRGSGRPGERRREPDQMASRAYHLVLRGVPAEALPRRLSRVRRALRVLLQLLLRERRRAAAARQARAADAALGATRCATIAPSSMQALARLLDTALAAGGGRADRARHQSRATAPGASAHRHLEPVRRRAAEARLPRGWSRRRRRPCHAARLGRFRGRHFRSRP